MAEDSGRDDATDGGRRDLPGDAGVDLRWARRQLLLTVVGSVIGILAVAAAIGGLRTLPLSAADARPLAIAAVVGAAVLAAACLVLLGCWLIQLGRWRADPAATDSDGFDRLSVVSLSAHLVGYAAVLVTMYAAIAASARAYWDSVAAALLGVTFLLAIFGQIVGGTQLLRRSGPPGTIPVYLRRLNAKVQSLR